MMLVKFADHKSAQTAMIVKDGIICGLLSYNTIVAELNNDGWLTINGLYSMTTRRHIGWFMKELGFTYQWAKQLFEDGMAFYIYTGEVKEI